MNLERTGKKDKPSKDFTMPRKSNDRTIGVINRETTRRTTEGTNSCFKSSIPNRDFIKKLNGCLIRCKKRVELGLREYNHHDACMLKMLHPCLETPLHVDIHSLNPSDRDLIALNFQMLPPQSELSWNCYVRGCHDGKFSPTQEVSSLNQEKDAYLKGETIFPHEMNADTFQEATVLFLAQRKIVNDNEDNFIEQCD